jgi:hypothetical protein
MLFLSIKNFKTTAVDDIDRNAPTNIPSVSLPPHNCNEETAKST